MPWPGYKQCPVCREDIHPAKHKCDCGFEFPHMPTACEVAALLATNNKNYVFCRYLRRKSDTEIAAYGIESGYEAGIGYGEAKHDIIRVTTFKSMLRKGWLEIERQRVEVTLDRDDERVVDIYKLSEKGRKAHERKARQKGTGDK